MSLLKFAIRGAIGIGMIYTICTYGFKLGRVYESGKHEGKDPGIEVTRAVNNDILDVVEQLKNFGNKKTIDDKVQEDYVKKPIDEMQMLREKLEKKYKQMEE